jgi:hypothetical protein
MLRQADANEMRGQREDGGRISRDEEEARV